MLRDIKKIYKKYRQRISWQIKQDFYWSEYGD